MVSAQPRVFIGSTGEALDLATDLQALLERKADVYVWSQGVFGLNKSNLDNLLTEAQTCDFACIFATGDDFLLHRGEEFQAPRDNILFEFGLFLGALGPERVFLLHPRDRQLKLPTDLGGISLLDFKSATSGESAQNVLGPSAVKIGRVIDRLGCRKSHQSRRYSSVLNRGGIDQITALADAALYFPRRRFGYRKEIGDFIMSGEAIPALYYYFTEEGAEFWMRMSSDPRYIFQNNSISLIRAVATKIANTLPLPIDIISLGSGDGEKDRIVLEAFTKKATKEKDVFYYPIDISDKLLVECVKNVFKGELARSHARTRAILGDFCDLGVLRAVYEDRPVRNLFSILGNTLGNTDEAKILNGLKEAMYSGDFLLVEVNCSTQEASQGTAFLRSDFVREYCSLPLSMIGVDVDLERVSVNNVEGLSVFKSAQSVKTSYVEVQINGRTLRDVPLSHDHRYDFEGLCEELSRFLALDILLKETKGGAGIVLAQKK